MAGNETAYLLGIDNGGTVAKAVVFSQDGKEIAAAARTTELSIPRAGFTERDMNGMWKASADAVREAVQTAGIDPKQIRAVGTTGHGKGLYAVDAQGQPAGPGIISTDSRGKDIAYEIMNREDFRDDVYARAYQPIWPGHTAPILSWLHRYQPDYTARTRWFMSCKDYTRFRLTGRAAYEVTDAAGSGLYNVPEGRFDRRLFAAFGAEECFEKMPEVIQSAEIAGYVTADAARQTGLSEGTPVAGGLFDVNAGGLALGLTDPEDFGAIIGTWSISQFVSREAPKLQDQDELFVVQPHCIPGTWMVHEASPTSASNLDWFLQKICREKRDAVEETGESIYAYCNREIEQFVQEGRKTDALVLPFLYGNNIDAPAMANISGLTGKDGFTEMLAAFYEGICFCHTVHLEKLFRLQGRPKTLRFAGQATQSQPWMQMFADILEIPIVTSDSTQQLSALGAAMCAGTAVGVYQDFDDAVSRVVRFTKRYEPSLERRDYYQRKYSYYKDTAAALRPVWKRYDSTTGSDGEI
ncbi:MAG: carbohydrate kinase [Spirochaetales bacterium]|nr:carbohydrate kinase [Spirochaetales bacterium]